MCMTTEEPLFGVHSSSFCENPDVMLAVAVNAALGRPLGRPRD